MIVQLLEIFCYLPLVMAAVYTLYHVLKPQSAADEFFRSYDRLSLEQLIKKVELLGQLDGKSYEAEKKQIIAIHRQGELTPGRSQKLEEIITNTYFHGFKQKWTAFRMADPGLQLIFIFTMLSGFFIFTALFYYMNLEGKNVVPVIDCALTALIVFPLPLLLSVIYLGVLSIVLTVFRFVFPNKGSVIRAQVFLDELLKALKPGGRSTVVELPSIVFRPLTY